LQLKIECPNKKIKTRTVVIAGVLIYKYQKYKVFQDQSPAGKTTAL
jgi:hypothetical protein